MIEEEIRTDNTETLVNALERIAELEKEAEEWEKEITDNADVEIHFGKPVKVMPTRKQSFQKGAEFGYNNAIRWHDLRKNPDDLPKGEGLFAVYWSLGKIDGYTVINGFKNLHKDIVAWYEIPRFDEELK